MFKVAKQRIAIIRVYIYVYTFSASTREINRGNEHETIRNVNCFRIVDPKMPNGEAGEQVGHTIDGF